MEDEPIATGDNGDMNGEDQDDQNEEEDDLDQS